MLTSVADSECARGGGVKHILAEKRGVSFTFFQKMHENAIFSPRTRGVGVRRVRPMLNPPVDSIIMDISRSQIETMVFMVNVPAVSTYRPPGRSSRQRNGNVFKSEATLQNFRTLYFGKNAWKSLQYWWLRTSPQKREICCEAAPLLY